MSQNSDDSMGEHLMETFQEMVENGEMTQDGEIIQEMNGDFTGVFDKNSQNGRKNGRTKKRLPKTSSKSNNKKDESDEEYEPCKSKLERLDIEFLDLDDDFDSRKNCIFCTYNDFTIQKRDGIEFIYSYPEIPEEKMAKMSKDIDKTAHLLTCASKYCQIFLQTVRRNDRIFS